MQFTQRRKELLPAATSSSNSNQQQQQQQQQNTKNLEYALSHRHVRSTAAEIAGVGLGLGWGRLGIRRGIGAATGALPALMAGVFSAYATHIFISISRCPSSSCSRFLLLFNMTQAVRARWQCLDSLCNKSADPVP
ncbi:hypothetical protein AWZ03_002184 [Drosophila navojoa]|uniref:Uncharacterized protein n=1 Tax=Drosophila navojoa TaxID=7232 RepID=A0A484BRG8_DRONA|nr:hypothetical protein AWZ03_002184 [Drosophila navojoa]